MNREINGIVRKIDNLGRMVIPVEYLKKLGIDKETEVEIFSTNDEIVIKKYSSKDKLERDFENLICRYGVDRVREICNVYRNITDYQSDDSYSLPLVRQ